MTLCSMPVRLTSRLVQSHNFEKTPEKHKVCIHLDQCVPLVSLAFGDTGREVSCALGRGLRPSPICATMTSETCCLKSAVIVDVWGG